MTQNVLVVGASGLIGTAVIDAFLEHDRSVIAMSRRAPEVMSERSFRHLPVDLLDAAEVERVVATELGSVTHVVYTAVYEKPGLVAGWSDPEQMSTNLKMFSNLLDPLAKRGQLEHVTILQGTKAYGVHLHPIPVPARERYPRDAHENFYWLQEDHLRALAEQHQFRWTIFRPTVVLGPNIGVAMNVLPVVGVFAAIARETGTPFGYPGHISYVREAVDVRLIGEAAVWAADASEHGNQHYNLTNGEVFSWQDLWPLMSDVLGIEPAPQEPRSMTTFLPDHAQVWERVVERHGLQAVPLPNLLGNSHEYADFCFGYGLTSPPAPAFVSTVKIKEHGFTMAMDTSRCVEHWLRELMRRRILPTP